MGYTAGSDQCFCVIFYRPQDCKAFGTMWVRFNEPENHRGLIESNIRWTRSRFPDKTIQPFYPMDFQIEFWILGLWDGDA